MLVLNHKLSMYKLKSHERTDIFAVNVLTSHFFFPRKTDNVKKIEFLPEAVIRKTVREGLIFSVQSKPVHIPAIYSDLCMLNPTCSP